jgi:hypothetical protein
MIFVDTGYLIALAEARDFHAMNASAVSVKRWRTMSISSRQALKRCSDVIRLSRQYSVR